MMKKRKGSTLVMALMVFSVLIIFSTFTVSSMVTENKQSIYHQHKTRAYYVARSGAEAMETAIRKLFIDDDPTDREALIANISTTPDKVLEETTQDYKLDVDIWKEDVSSDKINILINSTASANETSESVTKVLPIDVTSGEDELISFGDKPIIALNSASQNLIGKGWVEIVGEEGRSKYPEYVFQYQSYGEAFNNADGDIKHNIYGDWTISNNATWGSEGRNTVYLIDGDVIIDSKNSNINVLGKVDIYVRGTFNIKQDIHINKDGLSDNLNIYVYNTNNNEYGLEAGRGKKIDFTFYGNFYVNTGVTHLDGHKVDYKGNIISNGDKLYFKTQDNSGQHHVYIGLVYAPNSDMELDVQGNSAYNYFGYIVGNNIEHAEKLSDKTIFDKNIPGGGVSIPPIYVEGKPVFSINSPGYYK